MNTGQEFVKKIGPFGCLLFLALSIAFLVYCFTFTPKNPLSSYLAPHNCLYYSENDLHMLELKSELEENVFPYLSGMISGKIENEKLVVSINGDDFVESRETILKYYDEELFYFKRR